MPQKFYRLQDAVKYAVDQHKRGESCNPAGFRISGTIIGYTDNSKGYRNVNCIQGNFIRAATLGDLINNIHKALDDDMEVLIPTASTVSGTFRVSLRRLDEDERKAKAKPEVQGVQKPVHTEVEVQAEEVLEEAAAVEVEEPIEESSGDTESVSGESSEPEVDWDYAEAIIDNAESKTKAKDELAAYALDNFGVELSTKKKFENMIKDFKDAING